MKKKSIISFLAAVLLIIGFIKIVPALASEKTDLPMSIDTVRKAVEQKAKETEKGRPGEGSTLPEDINELRMKRDILKDERLISMAKKYGISLTEENQSEAIKQLRLKMIIEKAKEFGINTDGKSEEEILKELQAITGTKASEKGEKEQLPPRQKAEQIKPRKKIDEARVEAVLKAKEDIIKNEAKKYGISTEGKSVRELLIELQPYLKSQNDDK